MTFLPIDRPMQRSARAKKYRGVWSAVVVENKDTPPDNPGYRCKITIPALAEDQKTFWARLAVPMSGNDRGTYFLPDKDDQLLVVFEHGDIHRPIIIGAVWSKKHPPVEVNQTGKNNTKLIKSRSGHRLIFDDKEGAEKITIVDNSKKNKIVLDSANKIIKIECAGDIEVKAKQNVIMHSNALKIGTTETLTGTGQSVLTHAASTFNVKASSEINVTGSQVTINVSNSPACNVSGSGEGELGAMSGEQPKDQVIDHSRTAGTAPGSTPQNASPSSSQDDTKPEPDNFTLWLKPDAIRGGTLVGEMVQIIDPATKKVLQEVQVDADGNVLASVPDNKSYDLNILGTAHVIPGEGIENAALVTSFLHTAMFDASGEPLSEGVKVIVRGKGETHEFLTAVDGTISPHLEEGDYELEINGQKFAANTLRAHDLAHEGGSPLQFQLAPDDTDLDYDAMERGREHRGADPEA